jgi:hypothetical protein
MTLTNAQMTPDRFARWAKYRRLYRLIMAQLDAGNSVIASTYLKHTKISPKHRDMIKATRTGLMIQSGKQWLDYSLCKFTVVAK